MKKIFAVIVLLILGIGLLPAKSAFAIDPPANPLTINVAQSTVYGNLNGNGDMLFLFEINLGDNTYFPTDYTASQSLLVRLFTNNGTTEIFSVAPFTNPYYHNGYGHGIISMYFTAEDVATYGLVWSSSNYSVVISGNPAISWNGTAPNTAPIAVGNWINTNAQTSLKNRIIALAGTFRADWGLTVTLQDSNVLTSYGENYFIGTIPNLRVLCPQVFSGYLQSIQYKRRTGISVTYILALRNQWAGSWLDMSNVANDWGIGSIWVLGCFWTIVIFAAMWGTASISQSNKGLLWVAVMGIGVGGLLGFYPWSAFGLATICIILLIINETFWARSPS